MDSEKDKVPVEQPEVTIEKQVETIVVEQPEVTIEKQAKTTTEEPPETTVKKEPETIIKNQQKASIAKQAEATIDEKPETNVKKQPETTVENQQDTSIEKQNEVTVEKQVETIVKEKPETIVKNQGKATIKKQPETSVKERQENQNENTEKVNDLVEQTTNDEAKDEEILKDKQEETQPPLAEEQKVEDQKDPKETTKEETKVKPEIDNDEGEEKNVSTEITEAKKEKRRLSKRSLSISPTLSGEGSIIDSKSIRREIRAKKRKARLELLQKKEYDEESRFSDLFSSDSSSVHEERRLSNLLVFRESLLSDTMKMGLEEMSEHFLDSAKSGSVERTEQLYSLAHRTDFIENFEDLPSFSSFSVETSVDVNQSSLLLIKKSESVLFDQGVFVNPLTGEIDSSSSSTTTGIVNLSTHEEGEVEGEGQSDVDDFDIDIISIPEVPKDVLEEEDATKTFEAFAALKKDISIDDISETEEMILIRQQRAMAYEFLYQLIDAVVEKGEFIDQNALLSRSLSKPKLFHRLVIQLKLLVQEKLLNNELVRKTTDYYKRLKYFRDITPLPLDVHATEVLNYSNNLMRLDFMLNKENESLIHLYEQTDIESRNNDELENQLEESENNLKNVILKTFGNPRLASMKSRLETDLKVMARKRAEIGKARLGLIQRQHIVATLQEKLDALEKISGTLTLSTFISKQTEVLKIDKKIEERYLEFKKLQFTFTAELDKLAHIKEKAQFIEEKTTKQQKIFNQLLAKNLDKRELLYKLKLEHSKIIRKIREKSYQSGLLERPALMLDYDNTTDELSLQNEKVLQIQKKMNILHSKIEEAEEKLRNHIK